MASTDDAETAKVADIFAEDSDGDEAIVVRPRAAASAPVAEADSDEDMIGSERRKAAATAGAASDSDNSGADAPKRLNRLKSRAAPSASAASPSTVDTAPARKKKADDDDEDASGGDSDGSAKFGGKRRKKLPKRGAVAQRPQRQVKPRKPADADDADAARKRRDAKRASGAESGDEYDSGPEAERTGDDDAFIDRDGDDDELVAEYMREQTFNDEAPMAKKGKKRRRVAAPEDGEDEEGGGGTAEDAPGRKKGKGGKQAKGLSDEEKAAMVTALLTEMQAAARSDRADRAAGKPALHKLAMLDRVRTTTAVSVLHPVLLEGVARGAGAAYDEKSNPTILGCMREWLRPLPGTHIPAQQVREAVYDALERLPVAVDDLGSSRIGEVLFALSQHPEETPRNRDRLTAMIERFSRTIFEKSAKYNGGITKMLERQAELGLVSGPRSAAAAAASAPTRTASVPTNISDADLGRLLGDDLEAVARGLTSAPSAPEVRQSRHARMGAPLVFDYVIRPEKGVMTSSAEASASFAVAKPPKHSVNAAITKRIADLRRSKTKNAEKPMKMSIEGRGSTA